MLHLQQLVQDVITIVILNNTTYRYDQQTDSWKREYGRDTEIAKRCRRIHQRETQLHNHYVVGAEAAIHNY